MGNKLELSADDKADLTPEELAALQGEGAADILAGKPAGEAQEYRADEAGEAEGAQAASEAGAEGQAEGSDKPAGEGAQGEEASAEALAEIADDDQREATFVPKFQGEVPKDYAEQRKALLAKKAGAMKQLMDGEIDADQFAAVDAEVAEGLENLTAARVRAETLQAANEQAQASLHARAIAKIVKQAKKAGEIDYSEDEKARRQYDTLLNGLLEDPDNAEADFEDVAAQAHRALLALRGVQPKAQQTQAPAPAPAPAPAAAQRPAPPPGPKTLANLPAAAAAQVGDDLFNQFAQLEGEDAELFLAKQPPAVVEKLLRQAH
jgi:hypothetical protein